mgnify:CR=1 FL=1
MVLRDKKSSLPYLMMMSIILQPVRNDTPVTNEFEKEGNCGKSMCIDHINITSIFHHPVRNSLRNKHIILA